jgi:hypothetical protein
MDKGKYKDNVRMMQILQTALIAVCLVAAIGYIYFSMTPKTHKFTADDECGPMGSGGMISHTIGDEDACINICRLTYCPSNQMDYVSSKFTSLFEKGCNLCDCTCRERKQ